MVLYSVGILLLLEALFLAFPLLIAFIYKEDTAVSFLITIGSLIVAGGALAMFRPKDTTIYSREGFAIVTLGWIFMSLFGALPFCISGRIPNYLNALFETVSGFTTTGASILSEVEYLGQGLLFWRSFTHWIGGMGVLVFIMAVLNLSGGGGDLFIMRAEAPGPEVGKLAPKSRTTARILYSIYLGLTFLEFTLLMFGGLSFLESLEMAFGTAGTGGFSVRDTGCTEYSTYIKIVLTVFMILYGVNFNVYFFILSRKFASAFRNTEFWTYLGIITVSIVIISLNIMNLFGTYWESLLHSSFQVAALITTTGFASTDTNTWPTLSKVLMMLLMCIGASAGSTGGGFKVSRALLLLKRARYEVRKLFRPRSVDVITLDGKRIPDSTLHGTSAYFTIYVLIMIVSLIIVSFDKMDMLTNVSSVIATFNNIGPGFNVVGAMGNYSSFSAVSKIVFIVDMLLGRLEIFPLLILITPLFSRTHGRNKAIDVD